MGDRKGDRVRGRIEEQNLMRGGERERENLRERVGEGIEMEEIKE